MINELKELFRFLVGYVGFSTRTLNCWDDPRAAEHSQKSQKYIVYSAAVWNRFLWVIVIQDVLQTSGCTVALTKQVLGLFERAGCRIRRPEWDTPRSSNLSEEYNYYSTSMQIGLFISRSESLAECELKKVSKGHGFLKYFMSDSF